MTRYKCATCAHEANETCPLGQIADIDGCVYDWEPRTIVDIRIHCPQCGAPYDVDARGERRCPRCSRLASEQTWRDPYQRCGDWRIVALTLLVLAAILAIGVVLSEAGF